MLKKTFIIIFSICLIALVSLLVLENSERVDFTFILSTWKFEKINVGVLFITTFVIGFITAAFIAALYGLNSYFRERKLAKKDKTREDFFATLKNARQLSLVNNFEEAQTAWEKVLKLDKNNSIAKCEYAYSLLNQNKNAESVKFIEATRRDFPKDLEVLYTAADINAKVGNKTAAFDSLVLLLQSNTKNEYLLGKARDIAISLNKFEQALEFHQKIKNKTTSTDASYQRILEDINFEIMSAKFSSLVSIAEKKSALILFIQSNPNSIKALVELGKIESSLHNYDTAAQLFAKAARDGKEFQYWHEATSLWSKINPEKALSAAKNAVKESLKTYSKLEAMQSSASMVTVEKFNSATRELYFTQNLLIQTLLELNVLDEAEKEIQSFISIYNTNKNSNLIENKYEVNFQLLKNIFIHSANLLIKHNKAKQASILLESVTSNNLDLKILTNIFSPAI